MKKQCRPDQNYEEAPDESPVKFAEREPGAAPGLVHFLVNVAVYSLVYLLLELVLKLSPVVLFAHHRSPLGGAETAPGAVARALLFGKRAIPMRVRINAEHNTNIRCTTESRAAWSSVTRRKAWSEANPMLPQKPSESAEVL